MKVWIFGFLLLGFIWILFLSFGIYRDIVFWILEFNFNNCFTYQAKLPSFPAHLVLWFQWPQLSGPFLFVLQAAK